MLREMSDCEHVTKLHEAFTEGDNLNILTELCAGGTLADKIDREGPLPTATAAKFLEALANFANDCIRKGTLSALLKLLTLHARGCTTYSRDNTVLCISLTPAPYVMTRLCCHFHTRFLVYTSVADLRHVNEIEWCSSKHAWHAQLMHAGQWVSHQRQVKSLVSNVMLTAGIWHNDIKPDNILLVSSHPDSDMKVADFGFARTHQYCQSGQVILGYGTKGYMAPEVEQHEWQSHQSEMYSIGAVFYYMVCGEDHFHFDDGKATSAGLLATCMVAARLVYTGHALSSISPCSVVFLALIHLWQHCKAIALCSCLLAASGLTVMYCSLFQANKHVVCFVQSLVQA